MTDVKTNRKRTPLKEDTTKFPKKSRCIKTNKPRPYLCPICTRGFVRHEHLKRHQRSHTRERPFLCVLCGRCFARKDLVIRHQQKLHPFLMDDSNQLLNNDSNEINYDDLNLNKLKQKVDKDQIENGILKLVDNTETILPVGLGKVKRKRSSRKASASPGKVPPKSYEPLPAPSTITNAATDTNVSTVKRNASFSAGSSLTYTKSVMNHFPPVLLNQDSNATIPRSQTTSSRSTSASSSSSARSSSSNGAPKEVGFSTPQMTGQQVYNKAQQYGILDQDPLILPPVTAPHIALSRMNTSQSIVQPRPVINFSNDKAPIPATTSSFLNALPSLTDMITLGSTNNGFTNKDSSLRMSLTSFDYKLTNLPPPVSYPPPEQMLLPSSSNRPTHTPLSMFTTIGHNTDSSRNNKSKLNTVTTASTNTPITTATSTQTATNTTIQTSVDMDPSKDQWINKLLEDNMVNNNYNCMISPQNFNDIGFYPSNSSSSRASSNISKDEEIVQPSLNFPNHLTTGISEYFTSRQLDIFKVQSELLKSQGNMIDNELTSSSATTKSPETVLSNSSVGTNIRPTASNSSESSSANEDDDDDDNDENDALRINFKAKHTPTSRSTSVTNTLSSGSPSASTTPAVNFASQSHSNVLAISSGTGLCVGDYSLFNESIRQFIIHENGLNDKSFPTVGQLNDYVNLYELEFARFFPFVHMPTLEPSTELYPLFTSMAMIGALYAFRSSHTKILSSVTNAKLTKLLFQLQNGHFEDNRELNPSIPTWILQTMTFIIILGIFNDSGKVIKEMNTYMMSLIDLVMKYHVNLPLEQSMQPPFDDNVPTTEYITEEQMNKNFEYFVLAQERIRVCHTLLLISNFFASLVGLQCCFHSIDLKCGVPTIHEDLFRCSNAVQWYHILQRKGIVIDSKYSLIQLSNGGELYENCLLYLSNGDQYFFQNSKLSKLTLLSLLVSIHEKIYLERNNVISQLSNINDTCNLTMPEIDQYWKIHHRPYIDMMLKYWEKLFIKNGGVLDINSITIPMIDQDPLMRAVLPLYLFSKIRRALDISYVMNRIWLKDWSSMNRLLDDISYDWDALRETTEYCLFLLDSWTSIVLAIREIPTRKFTKKSGYRTPITSITTLFVATSILAEYLKKLEGWASNYNRNNRNGTITLNDTDKILYVKIIRTLKRVQHVLVSGKDSMKLYLEFLQIQNKQHITTLDELDNENEIMFATSPNATIQQTADLINKLNLSSRTLYLGVRILRDSPVWPIVMVFAHALQSRAIFNVSSEQNFPK